MRVHRTILMISVLFGLAAVAWSASARSLSLATAEFVPASMFSDEGTHGDHSHDMADIAAHAGDPLHNPDDHSHPFGQDNYHQKVSHASLDFAFNFAVTPLSWVAAGPAEIFAANEYERGLTLSPPVPPPL